MPGRPDGPRDPVAGPDSGPEPPFPLRLNGKVIKGFGRGSAEVRAWAQFFSRLWMFGQQEELLRRKDYYG